MFGPIMYSAATIQEDKATYMDGSLAIWLLSLFSPAVHTAARISGGTVQYIDGTLVIFFVAFSVLLCTLRPEFQEEQYSTWTELSQFFPGISSPALYSAVRNLGKTAEYMHGTLAISLLACSVLLCTLRPKF